MHSPKSSLKYLYVVLEAYFVVLFQRAINIACELPGSFNVLFIPHQTVC
jgi:hypothetical protein